MLDQPFSEWQCDVLLATACGAKGLEWDQVVVLDDYCRLLVFERVPDQELQAGEDYKAIHEEGVLMGDNVDGATPTVPMRFAPPNDWKGDELNSWYVAITRARLRLQLPERFTRLHETIWVGAGYTPDPSNTKEPQYTEEEIAGIDALLAKMRSMLAPPGNEFQEDAGSGTQGSSTSTAGVASSPAAFLSSPVSIATGHALGTPSPIVAMRSLQFTHDGA